MEGVLKPEHRGLIPVAKGAVLCAQEEGPQVHELRKAGEQTDFWMRELWHNILR